MRRRSFILAGLGAAGAYVAWQFVAAQASDTLAMIIRRRLDYLDLEPEGVRRFSQDMAALHGLSSVRTHLIGGLRVVYTRCHLSAGDNALARLLRHGEDRVVSSYLISTDFFLNGADQTRIVRYLGMLSGKRACANPFARPPEAT